ncbi:MAG: hypothetical protein FWD25_09180 [Clostridia bacterium]|nr:hypothetical protein [Clostridia bacterium]
MDAASNKKLHALLAATAAALPGMFFFFLVNQNQDYLPLVPCLLVGGAFAAAGLLAYAALAWIFRTHLVLFTILLPAWTLFFTYGTLYKVLALGRVAAWARPLVLLALLFGAFVVLALLFRVAKSKTPFAYFSFIIVFVFAFNLISVTGRGIETERSRRAAIRNGLDEMHIKTDFFMDEDAARPNIYWFHTDGRMSIKNVEKYFGDAQEEFVAALHERGFVINTDAYLLAGATDTAIPALMCPNYYDHVQREKLEQYAMLTNTQKRSLGAMHTVEDQLARQNNELLYAFFAAGYEMNTIAMDGIYFFPMHRHYELWWHQLPLLIERRINAGQGQYAMEYQREAELRALADLLDRATMLPQLGLGSVRTMDYPDSPALAAAQANFQARVFYYIEHAFFDIMQRAASPRFVTVMEMTPHAPFKFDESGQEVPQAMRESAGGYLAHQKFGEKWLWTMLDLVLESDPGAVIVLQSDHGIHTKETEDQMRADGYTDEQIIEIQNGVFSAVRIPAQYGGIPEELLPLDPRNVARLLVNRFVGENYTYIH